MKLEIDIIAYENIIFELYGIAYLLHYMATVLQEENGKSAYHSLRLLHSCVKRNASQLQEFMENPKSSI